MARGHASRVAVPAHSTLYELHRILQVVMGWTDSHLHQFRSGNTLYGQSDPNAFDAEAINRALSRRRSSWPGRDQRHRAQVGNGCSLLAENLDDGDRIGIDLVDDPPHHPNRLDAAFAMIFLSSSPMPVARTSTRAAFSSPQAPSSSGGRVTPMLLPTAVV